MKQKLLYFSVIAICLACHSPEIKTEKENPSNLSEVPSDDKEMNEAIAKSKSTLNNFDQALQSDNFDTSTFALKVKFPTATGAEHIWATSIVIKDNKYYGIVDNLPELTTKVKAGERVQIEKDNISDWMYSDKGNLCGGYTLKLIRRRLSKEERNKFDANFQFKIVD